jgi:hypothetical protein
MMILCLAICGTAPPCHAFVGQQRVGGGVFARQHDVNQLISDSHWGVVTFLRRSETRPSGAQSHRMSSQDEQQSEKGFAELASALAVLDQEQKNNQNKNNRWKKLDLRTPIEKAEDKESGYSTTTDFSSLLQATQPQAAYLLEPPNGSTPTSLILFLGGAVLGTYPQVAYNEFLHRLSSKTNAAVLAIPYNVGLDHLEIAKHSEKMFSKAMEHIETKYKPEWKNALEVIPQYALGHSLGCKLHTLRMAAVPQSSVGLTGVGFMAFNNYGFSRSVGMARSFASQIFGAGPAEAQSNGFNMNTIFELVEQVTSFAGLEFTPSPKDTERIIELKLASNPELQFPRKCRLFQFEDDNLDCSTEFDACFKSDGSPENFNPDFAADAETSATGDTEVTSIVQSARTSIIPTTRLPGTHLTPVYLNVQLKDILKNTPPEAEEIAKQMTDLQGVSFGDEKELDKLVDSVVKWMQYGNEGFKDENESDPILLPPSSSAADV